MTFRNVVIIGLIIVYTLLTIKDIINFRNSDFTGKKPGEKVGSILGIVANGVIIAGAILLFSMRPTGFCPLN